MNSQIEIPLIFVRTLHDRAANKNNPHPQHSHPQDHWYDDTRTAVLTNHFDDADPEPATYPLRLQLAQAPARWKMPQKCDVRDDCKYKGFDSMVFDCVDGTTQPQMQCYLVQKATGAVLAQQFTLDAGLLAAYQAIMKTPFTPGCVTHTRPGLTVVPGGVNFAFEQDFCEAWKPADQTQKAKVAQKHFENACWHAAKTQNPTLTYAEFWSGTTTKVSAPPFLDSADNRHVSATAIVRIPLVKPTTVTRIVLHYRFYHWNCLYDECKVPPLGPTTILHEGDEEMALSPAIEYRLSTKAVLQGLEARLVSLNEWGEETELVGITRGRTTFPTPPTQWKLAVYDEATEKALPAVLPRPEFQELGLLAARLTSPEIPVALQNIDPRSQRLVLRVRIVDTTSSPYFDRVDHHGTYSDQSEQDAENPPMYGRLVCPVHLTLHTL